MEIFFAPDMGRNDEQYLFFFPWEVWRTALSPQINHLRRNGGYHCMVWKGQDSRYSSLWFCIHRNNILKAIYYVNGEADLLWVMLSFCLYQKYSCGCYSESTIFQRFKHWHPKHLQVGGSDQMKGQGSIFKKQDYLVDPVNYEQENVIILTVFCHCGLLYIWSTW